jgi:hypothetical protein
MVRPVEANVAFMSLIPGAERQNFKGIFEKYKALGKGAVRLTQSALFTTQLIDPTKTTYTFPILETDKDVNTDPSEIRLNINDEFIVTSMLIGLYGSLNMGQQMQSKEIFTHAPINQNAAFVTVRNLYSGKFRLGVNNVIYIEKWDVKRHEFIPRTEFSNTFAAAPFAGATIPSMDWSRNGFYPMQPMVTLSGAKKNELTIELPAAISGATGTLAPNEQGNTIAIDIQRICILFRGYNAQNAAKFQ